MSLDNLMEQLHDIEGLDTVNHWPLSRGEWVLFITFFLLFVGVIVLIGYWIRYKRSWKNYTFLKLSELEDSVTEETLQVAIVDFSEYLRRIAVQSFPRSECAGLTGEAWLRWLSAHDPKGFDWEKKGKLLLEAPYAPSKKIEGSFHQIKDLIQAAKQWVC